MMMSKWKQMNVMGKTSYLLALALFVAIPVVGLSVGLFNHYLISTKAIYVFYTGVMLFAAVAKQWKLFFGIMAGSLVLSSIVMGISDIVFAFM